MCKLNSRCAKAISISSAYIEFPLRSFISISVLLEKTENIKHAGTTYKHGSACLILGSFFICLVLTGQTKMSTLDSPPTNVSVLYL